MLQFSSLHLKKKKNFVSEKKNEKIGILIMLSWSYFYFKNLAYIIIVRQKSLYFNYNLN